MRRVELWPERERERGADYVIWEKGKGGNKRQWKTTDEKKGQIIELEDKGGQEKTNVDTTEQVTT